MFNILIRTANRPLFFKECLRSIASQQHPSLAIRCLVSIDAAESRAYVEEAACEYPNLPITVVEVPKVARVANSHFPYNTYCNLLQSQVEDGWIMYLDDDDVFLQPDALQQIANACKDSHDSLVLWRVKFPDPIGLVPSDRKFARKIVTQIGYSAIGFCYHAKWREIAVWDDRKGADGRLIYRLSKQIPNKVWLDVAFTGINYQTGAGGLGKAKDLQ